MRRADALGEIRVAASMERDAIEVDEQEGVVVWRDALGGWIRRAVGMAAPIAIVAEAAAMREDQVGPFLNRNKMDREKRSSATATRGRQGI